MERPLPCDTLKCSRRLDGRRRRGLEFLRVDIETCCDSLERSSVFDRVSVLTSDQSGNLLSMGFSCRLDGSSSNESIDKVRLIVDSMILSSELSRS